MSDILELKKPACIFPNLNFSTLETLGKHARVDGTYCYEEEPLGHLVPRVQAKAGLKNIVLGCLLTSVSSLLIHSLPSLPPSSASPPPPPKYHTPVAF